MEINQTQSRPSYSSDNYDPTPNESKHSDSNHVQDNTNILCQNITFPKKIAIKKIAIDNQIIHKSN